MIQSVGIDFGHGGAHKVCCLDQGAQLCDGFTFQTTPKVWPCWTSASLMMVLVLPLSLSQPVWHG